MSPVFSVLNRHDLDSELRKLEEKGLVRVGPMKAIQPGQYCVTEAVSIQSKQAQPTAYTIEYLKHEEDS